MPELHLTRLSGFERGKRVRFDSSPIVLGTEATSSVRFDPTWDKTVSARHATIEWKGDSWVLVDQSREGCWINGQRVSGQRSLEPATEIELGRGGPKIKAEYALQAASAPHPACPPPLPAARTPGVAPAAEGKPSATPDRSHGSQGPAKILLIVGAALLVLLLAALAGLALMRHGADEALAEAAQKYEQAVGVVVLTGNEGPFPFGTAWAVGDHVLATNSHVAKPVGEILQKGGDVYVVLNKNPDKKFRITQAVFHPLYEGAHTNMDGHESAVPAYDVGLLVVKEKLPVAFHIAPQSELKNLRSGYRVAYLGFPSEGMAGGGVDPRNPVATMQSGIVTSVTDWWLSKADFDKALLVQHNLAATGGASGSPIFNASGDVIALLSAGNIIGQVQVGPDGSAQVIRAPSAAMVNFAQRADLLQEFIDKAEK